MTDKHIVISYLNCFQGPTPNGRLRLSHDEHGRPRDEFARKRIDLYRQYTLRSLLNQDSDEFSTVLFYDKSTVQELIDELLASEEVAALGERFQPGPIAPLDFRRDVRNTRWARRHDEESVLRSISGGADRLVLTTIDSDDLFRRDALTRIRACARRHDVEAVVPTNGYIYDPAGRRLRPFHNESPPFYSLVYSAAKFFSGHRYDGGIGNHQQVRRRLRSVALTDRIFMVHVHDMNDSTTFKLGRPSRMLPQDEVSRVLPEFGIQQPASAKAASPAAKQPTSSRLARSFVTVEDGTVQKSFVTRERFARELVCYRMLSRFDVTPRLLDVDESSCTLVTEHGGPEARSLRSDQLPPDFAEQVFKVLSHMHAAGIAHRDFHTGNLLVGNDGIVRVVDFEWAHVYEAEAPALKECYDLTGTGLPSPPRTGHMHWDLRHRSSIRSATGIPGRAMYERYVRQLHEEMARISGFKSGERFTREGLVYQTFHHPHFSVQHAQRSIARRFAQFRVGKLSGRRVLDLGTNTGSVAIESCQRGARSVLGLDSDRARIDLAGKIAALTGYHKKIEFRAETIESFLSSSEDTFDVVFCLAVDAWVSDPYALYRAVSKRTSETLYFETNKIRRQQDVLKIFRPFGFATTDFRGTSAQEDAFGNRRLLFKMTKSRRMSRRVVEPRDQAEPGPIDVCFRQRRMLPVYDREAAIRQDLLDLRGAWKGRQVVIWGNGPSARDAPERWQADAAHVGVNASWRDLRDELDAYCISDQRFVNGPEKQRIAEQAPGVRVYLAHMRDVLSDDDGINFVRTVGSDGFCSDLTRGAFHGFSVVWVAMQLAVWCGAEDILLVGCEHTYAAGDPCCYTDSKSTSVEFDRTLPFILANYKQLLSVFEDRHIRLRTVGESRLREAGVPQLG